jgi:hypothetical protein
MLRASNKSARRFGFERIKKMKVMKMFVALAVLDLVCCGCPDRDFRRDKITRLPAFINPQPSTNAPATKTNPN